MQNTANLADDLLASANASSVHTQPTRLLTELFENVDREASLCVLNIGPAKPETVAFFGEYRCKLHITDLNQELPLPGAADANSEAQEAANLLSSLSAALALPEGVRFDIVFFWEVLNFLSTDTISALAQILRPHLHAGSWGHCLAVRGAQSPPPTEYCALADEGNLRIYPRRIFPPDFQPHSQSVLISRLEHFELVRTVLMRDQRLELLLKVSDSLTGATQHS